MKTNATGAIIVSITTTNSYTVWHFLSRIAYEQASDVNIANLKTNATGAIIVSITTTNSYTVWHFLSRIAYEQASDVNIANLNRNMAPKKRAEPMHYLEFILIIVTAKIQLIEQISFCL